MLNDVNEFIKHVEDNSDRITFPSLSVKVIDAGVFWNTLCKKGGYRIQKNTVTQHCRILDSNNIRRASGTESAMQKMLEQLTSTSSFK